MRPERAESLPKPKKYKKTPLRAILAEKSFDRNFLENLGSFFDSELIIEDSHLLQPKTPYFSAFETLDFLKIAHNQGFQMPSN